MICTFFQLHILEHVPHKNFSKAHHLNSKRNTGTLTVPYPEPAFFRITNIRKKQIWVIFCELAHPAIFGTAARYSQVTKGLELPVEGQSMGGREYGMASLAAPGASKAVKQTEPKSLRARCIFGLSKWGVPK